MKTAYLPIAAALLMGSTATIAAESDFKVYGKVNVSLQAVDDGTEDQFQLNSNASRIGLKGSRGVSDGLEVIYKMEYEVFVDDGDKDGSPFSQRNIYVGLKGGWGKFIVGRHDSPLKMAQGKVDRFGDLELGDMKAYAEGEDRLNNVLMYTSPSAGGFSGTLMLIPGEDGANDEGGLADGISASANYKNDLVKAAIAVNSDVDGQDTVRLVADFNVGSNAKAGFLLQQAENTANSAVSEDTMLVSGQISFAENWTLKAQLGMTEYSNDTENMQFALGADYKLDKKTKLFTYLSNIDTEVGATSTDASTLGAGFQLKF